MKKNYILILIIAFLSNVPNSIAQDIDFDANEFLWIDEGGPGAGGNGLGFMNVFFLDGSPAFSTGWGVPDLISEVNTTNNTTTLKPNRVNDSDPYWQTGNLDGNKIMDANHYIQDDSLLGGVLTFSASVQSNTLNNTGFTGPEDFAVSAFIKVFSSDFSAVLTSDEVDLRLTSGNFTLSVDTTDTGLYPAGSHIQYGFQFIGPNINNDPSFDTAYDNLGSIVISAPTLSISDLDQVNNINAYPNPSQSTWNIKSNSSITSIELFDALGRNVLSVNPNDLETTLDANNLPKGLYFATVTNELGVSTIKLIRE